MSDSLLIRILHLLLHVLTALLLSPLIPGLINKVKAVMAGRSGPPVLQLYYDLAKLVNKGVVWSTLASLLFAQLPWVPERRLRDDWVPQLLKAWGAPDWDCEAAAHYADAMRLPSAAHHVMEQARWQVRSTPRPAGQRYLSAVREPIKVPVLGLHGAKDRCMPAYSRRFDNDFVAGDYTFRVLPGAGHFLPEEASTQVTQHLLTFLSSLD